LGMVTGAPLALRHEVGELGWFGDESVQTVVQTGAMSFPHW
jgi:hypothetical protein